jgi:hypothetical protein
MCSWITEKAAIAGHGKGVAEWIRLTRANVYYDHPVSAPLDHALIIDFVDESAGPGARVSVELSEESARALLAAVQAALATGQAQHDLASGGPAADGPSTGTPGSSSEASRTGGWSGFPRETANQSAIARDPAAAAP